MAKQVTANSVSTPGKTRKRAVAKTAAPSVREFSHHEIAQHAYGLYVARGAGEGEALSDWLRAEHELRAQVG